MNQKIIILYLLLAIFMNIRTKNIETVPILKHHSVHNTEKIIKTLKNYN